ncbi:gamma-glutamylcyclotransferase family protein [Mariprofundus ferrooxydans]|uniref:gamma-glutamylcyclotransferase family protein n=1 Tax=Mariprofundus ferrooxydans TaxID=314344 RepID=UPI0003696FF0|nr:gamma-glutamylcyclotransferase family protein [Mariprofundus ferrooxydans]
MSETLTYFAYGSNMSSKRLQARVPSARVIGTATLTGHRLAFHKFSHVDLSAKCDACESADDTDRVIGVLYHLPRAEKPTLDKVEGLGIGYDEKQVRVHGSDGHVDAFMYAATRIDDAVKPFHWYKQHVIHGARENRLPDAYLAFIDSFESIDDPDNERHERELNIYGSTRMTKPARR